ncbi:LysE family translocator [archaeon]|jgi:threonine/homoserine/homoserine lactone efflux protein|nr:LysE family translocator [archaeon]MBT4648531.1 LysE family translocator [archaeon]MBT6821350.1 LysE family translocator [archaeon]MBT7391967.1 LysE family translocator [archaeon]
MFDFSLIVSGIIFGIAAGISPGPLLALIISETLQHGIKEGMKVAIAPLITDAPVMIIAIIITSRLSQITTFTGIVSLIGGSYLTYLAITMLKLKEVKIDIKKVKPQSLIKGITTNLLNPNLYIFWFSIAAPIIIKAPNLGMKSSFLISFYTVVIGINLGWVLLVGKARKVLKSREYILTMRVLGGLLFVYALYLGKNGLGLIGVI